MLTQQDIQQIKTRGQSFENIQEQLAIFKRGLPYIRLKSAAIIGDGIWKLTNKETEFYIDVFNRKKDQTQFVKFVPASGAASRMFKFLFKFLDHFSKDENMDIKKYPDLKTFAENIEKFPFYDKVLAVVRKEYPDYDKCPKTKKLHTFVQVMLNHPDFEFGQKPKGLLPFHRHKSHSATAFEEHFFEAAEYVSSDGKAALHFTISPQHQEGFDREFLRIQSTVETQTNTLFDVSFSYQKPATDTLAVTLDNEPFRLDNDELMFRPGGHGALLDNLNKLDADVVFVRNIDNIVVRAHYPEQAHYKKLLAGVLLDVQEKIFDFQKRLDAPTISENDLQEAYDFLSNELGLMFENEYETYPIDKKTSTLKSKLHRPLRVCGMVKNDGDTGGGPFWVEDEQGSASLQIVETVQIDAKDPHQMEILHSATHFNPVDLVCGLKNYKGERYNLKQFVNPEAAFITQKTLRGKTIKALELPGLWNGSMAYWNTIFVEVPLSTFNPVKTVNDLLKKPHQAL